MSSTGLVNGNNLERTNLIGNPNSGPGTPAEGFNIAAFGLPAQGVVRYSEVRKRAWIPHLLSRLPSRLRWVLKAEEPGDGAIRARGSVRRAGKSVRTRA